MKKIFSLVSVLAIAGAAATSFAADREGKVALGFQGNVDSIATSSMGDWSLKYGMSPQANLQLLVGFDLGKNIDKNFNVGARFLYDVVENENSDFYTGLGILYVADETVVPNPVRVSIPLGFEFSFAGLPEIGFNAEVGAVIDFATKGGSKPVAFRSVGNVGGALGLGAHYYF